MAGQRINDDEFDLAADRWPIMKAPYSANAALNGSAGPVSVVSLMSAEALFT
jgi:hypothetical protein